MYVFLCRILKMLKLTVIFGVITIFLSVQRVENKALKSLEIQGILESLQKQLQLEQIAKKKRLLFSTEALDDYYNQHSLKDLDYVVRSSKKKKQNQRDRDVSYDRDDDDDSRDHSPQLLYQSEGANDKQSRDFKKLLNKQKSSNSLAGLLGDGSDEDRVNRHHKSKSVKKLLGSLLETKNDEDAYDGQQKSRPGSALASLLDDREDDKKADHLQDLSSYKSVYLVLDPEAVEKSHTKDKLGHLLSKLLNTFRQTKQQNRGENRKERHYEEFAGRRKGRDGNVSKDRYDNSPERDYPPPKRSRPERSGGGGGSRTAIPYGGHRGDIYEKDN